MFGVVDLVIVMAFLAITYQTTILSLSDLVVNFLLPVNVSCCICFRVLYSRWEKSEYIAVLSCLVWVGLWMMIVANDVIYQKLVTPVWVAMLILTFVYFIFVFRSHCYLMKKFWRITRMKLEFKNVTKQYGEVNAVNKVNCVMEKGIYGLLGVNGAGKTTLMRMLCTIVQSSEGQILWNGKDIWKLGGEYREVLGYLPQDFGYYPDLTVYDYMMYISSIKGLKMPFARKK